MRRDDFEKKLLDLWMTSRVPLTRTNVQYYTKAPRRQLEPWLDELVREDVLDLIVGNDGEVRWKVMGAKRPLEGALSFEELEGRAPKDRDLDDTFADVKKAARASMALREVSAEIKKGTPEGGKSYLWSGGLSFFLGPLGWLYAGSTKEAVPASIVFALMVWLLPYFLLGPICGLGLPISGIIGLVYAWKYNRSGSRQTILEDDDTKDPKELSFDE